MVQTFWIKGQLTGLNKRINADRTNRFVGAKLKKANLEVIEAYIRQYRIKPMKSPISIEITWVEPNKKRDKDNIASAIKDIQDALVAEGIIKNDGWNDIEGFIYHFLVDKDHPHVEVRLEGELE